MAGIRRRRVKGKSKGGSRSASIGGTSQTSFAGASMSTFEPPAEETEGERPKAEDLATQTVEPAGKKPKGEADPE